MGKPSSTKLSRSFHSLCSKKSRKSLCKMNFSKKQRKLKQKSKKQKKSIQKLFNTLRNQSRELDNVDEANSTVICLDDTCNTESDATSNATVICLNDSVSQSPINMKRKLSQEGSNSPKHKKKKNIKSSKSAVELETNSKPCTSNVATPSRKNSPAGSLIFSSTPKTSYKKNISTLNISNLSNDNNNKLDITANFNKKIEDLTKQINDDSYLTIDLTTESLDLTKTTANTVIDLERDNDCTIVSVSNDTLSMSGDSNVTVLRKSQLQRRNDKKLQRVADDVASLLNANQKKKLFKIITQTLLNGCDVSLSGTSIKQTANNSTETAEDTFIKEVILGETPSRNSIGSNIYNPAKEIKTKSGLRMVVIDGSNVAMGHGQHSGIFSVKGLKICIDYFVRRGHIVKAFVPRFRCKFGKSTEPRVLDDLERQGLVVYTPSREVQGRFIVSYDDRYIVQCAAEFDGVIVSGDNYRDLMLENPRWKYIIENRLLQFTWVNDMIMFPKDPLGRYGPKLENFLRHSD